jgi:hypothetical protein
MVDNENDDPTWADGPIVVRRAVYEATQRFEKTLGPGAPGAVGIAQERGDKYRDAGNKRSADRWYAIYRYLMWQMSVPAGMATVILKPGEKYDYENEKVIKPRARRPRNGKGSR